MEGNIVHRPSENESKIFRQYILSRGLGSRQQQIFPLQQGCGSHFQHLPSVKGNRRLRQTVFHGILHRILIRKAFHIRDQGFTDTLGSQKSSPVRSETGKGRQKRPGTRPRDACGLYRAAHSLNPGIMNVF